MSMNGAKSTRGEWREGQVISCGLWSTTRTLVAAVVEDGILCSARSVAWSDDAEFELLQLIGDDAQVVLPQSAADRDDLAKRLRPYVSAVWCAPDGLVDELRRCSLLRNRPARFSAAMLAWLPHSPRLRQHLVRLPGGADGRPQGRSATAPKADRPTALLPCSQAVLDPEVMSTVDAALDALVRTLMCAHPEMWDHERPRWRRTPDATLPIAKRVVELAQWLRDEIPGYRLATELMLGAEQSNTDEPF